VRRWQLDNLTTIDAQNELSALVSLSWNKVNTAETKAQHASGASPSGGK